jgi:hypothetical protein
MDLVFRYNNLITFSNRNFSTNVLFYFLFMAEHDWSRVPIGSLPSITTDKLELEGVDWELVEVEAIDCNSDRIVNGTKRTGERFDWNSLLRKRRRRGGLTKEGPVGHVAKTP